MIENLYGEFVWWHGVVESREDPLKLGRIQVRIHGYHTDNLIQIPSDDLPWAIPLQPITSAAMNGIGTTPLGLVEGTNVIGFFRDGLSCQDPIIMGSTAGIPEDKPDTKKGFNDPNGKYPIEDFLDEPDTNRLARKDIEHEVIQTKKDGIDKNVPIALDGTWSEPETEFDPTYPFNHVTETEAGHIFEVDDTTGKERIHEYHKTGTFSEIFPDGSKVTKIVKDDYEIVAGNKNVHIKGDCNVTVDDNINIRSSSGNITIEVADGNCIVDVQGNVTANVTGNVTGTIGGNLKADIEGTTDINGTLPMRIIGSSSINIEAAGPLVLKGVPILEN